jgi:hypothetical protein
MGGWIDFETRRRRFWIGDLFAADNHIHHEFLRTGISSGKKSGNDKFSGAVWLANKGGVIS